MDVTVRADGALCEVSLRGTLDIYAAATLRPQLLEWLQAHAQLRLDLSEVDDIDSAGLQLLMAAKKQAAQQDRVLTLAAHSPAILETLQLCQLLGYFGDPVVELGAAHREAA